MCHGARYWVFKTIVSWGTLLGVQNDCVMGHATGCSKRLCHGARYWVLKTIVSWGTLLGVENECVMGHATGC